MLSIAAATSQMYIASPAFQVGHMSQCSCFWGINQTLSRTSGQFFFLALVTLLQGIHADVNSLPQECCCGSICKWLITGKEQDEKVPVGNEAPMNGPGVSEVLRWYSSHLITVFLPFQNMDVKNSPEAQVGKISNPGEGMWNDWSFCINGQVCKT